MFCFPNVKEAIINRPTNRPTNRPYCTNRPHFSFVLGSSYRFASCAQMPGHTHCVGIIHSGLQCTLSRKHPGQPISLRAPCTRCHERRCRTHCRCGRTGTAVGRAGGRPAPKAAAAPQPKAKAKPKAMPKAVAVPPPVVVAGPAGPMSQLSMERLRPPEWHRAIVEAVATAMKRGREDEYA